MKPTDEQLRAIEKEGNLIVSAGAGSGKTAVLSRRVLHFIKNKGFKISEFLIVTFTNLAASEMKERIRKILAKENLEDANEVDTADICTFDSFAFSLVKKYHFHLGLPADVGIIDENIIGVRVHTLINDIFNRYYLKGDNDVFNNMIEKYCLTDDDILQKLTYKMYKYFASQINSYKAMNEYVSIHTNTSFIEENIIKPIINKINEHRKYVENTIPFFPQEQVKKKEKETYFEAINAAFSNFLHASDDYNVLIETCPTGMPFSIKTSAENSEIMKEFKKEHGDFVTKFLSLLPSNKESIYKSIQENIPMFNLLVDIVREVNNDIMEFKKKYNVYSFDDIQRMALNLLRENESIKEEIKNKYKMIMIDEYQDTSLVQESFIDLIANNNLYMVGDIKQSIYRFRNAKCELFQNRYDLYKGNVEGHVIDMNTNFRSRGQVLNPINVIFSEITIPEFGGINYIANHIIEVGNKAYSKQTNDIENNNIEVLEVLYDSKKHDQVNFEAHAIANDIIHKINNKYQVATYVNEEMILRDCSFSDFCILISKSTDFNYFYKIFNKYNIPLFIQKDDDISTNDLVLIILNILKLVKYIKEDNIFNNIAFKHAYISLARSFVYSYTDEEIFDIVSKNNYYDDKIIYDLKNIIENSNNVNNCMLFENLIFELGLYDKIISLGNVKKNELYIDKIIGYFKDMSKLDYSIDEFISFLENIDEYDLSINVPSTNDGVDSVRIMTIHKSKGLEFPIVYFPELNKKFNKEEMKSKIGINDFGIVINDSSSKKLNVVQEVFKIHESYALLSEQIRLFYVALTRAKEKIVFVTHKDVNKGDSNKDALIKPLSIKDDCFLNILHNFFVHRNYNLNVFDSTTQDVERLNITQKDIVQEEFEMFDLDIQEEELITNRASKNTSITTSKNSMEFGTKLHELMEVIDFNTKDISFVKEKKMIDIINKFFDCELLHNVKNGKIYKEYAFYDNENEVNGIIDLMIEYEQYIDIIDYKSNNINDDEYVEQLRIYREFVSKSFKKDVNTYLYSLMKGTYIKVD